MTVVNIITTAAAVLLCALCAYKMIRKSPLPEQSRASVAAGKFCDKYALQILALIFALALFTRFYRLAELPDGVNIDEAAAAYSAFTLKEYGVDRYLNPSPVYFQNFFGGQSALYIWLTALVYKIGGVVSYSLFAARFTAALFSSLTVIFAYFLLLNLFEQRKTAALFGSFLTAVCPVFIMTGRFGLDCYLMLPFFTLSLMCISGAVKRDGVRWYIISGTAFGITLYSYAVSYLVIPLFLALLLAALLILKKIKLKQIIALGVPLFLFALPLIIFLAVNAGFLPVEPFSAHISVLDNFTRGSGGEFSLFNALRNIFKLDDLFLNDGLNYNAVDGYYTMYLFSIPLIFFGAALSAVDAVKALKSKELNLLFVPLFAALVCVAVFLLMENPNINKLNALYICFVCFAVRAVSELAKRLRVGFAQAAAAFAVMLALFLSYYFTDYRVSSFVHGVMETYTHAREKHPEETMYVGLDTYTTTFDGGYIFTLLADFEDPHYYDETHFVKYGVDNYGKNRFFLPVVSWEGEIIEDVDPDGVYLIYQLGTETTEYANALLDDAGFSYEEYLSYRIYDR